MHVVFLPLFLSLLTSTVQFTVHRKKPWVYGVPNPNLLMLIGGIDSEEHVLDEVMVIMPNGSVCNFTDENKILLEFPIFQAAAVAVSQGVLLCGGYNDKFIWQRGCQFWRPGSAGFARLPDVAVPSSRLRARARGRVEPLKPQGRGLDEAGRQGGGQGGRQATVRAEGKRAVERRIPKVPKRMPSRGPRMAPTKAPTTTEQAIEDSPETSSLNLQDLSSSATSPGPAQPSPSSTSQTPIPTSTETPSSSKLASPNTSDPNPPPTTSPMPKAKHLHGPGEGDLEYSGWTGKVGHRWGSLSVTTLMINFESEDLMAIPDEEGDVRDSFWYVHSFAQATSFMSARFFDANLTGISWAPKTPPDLLGHYPDSVGACPLIVAGRLLMIGSTNEHNKGVLIFNDGKSSEKILRFHQEDLGVNGSLGNWSDFAVMSTGLPGEARDYFGCTLFCHNPIFTGGLTYQMDKFIMSDVHHYSVKSKKWDANYKMPSMKVPRFKHTLVVLSDGWKEHLLNVFGFSSGGLLTNTLERYIHSEHPAWVLHENVRPEGPMARYAHVVIPAEWLPQCPVDRVEENRAASRSSGGIGGLLRPIYCHLTVLCLIKMLT